MRLLITGGLGYVGGRIATYCSQKDPNLEIILTTRKNRKSFPEWTNNFKIINLDLLDESSITKCVRCSNPDCIIHLAAVNEIDSEANPSLAWDINYYGTEKLLRAAQTEGIEKFIYFSTFHVYGLKKETVITEDSLTRPVHPYSITHLAAEEIVQSFRRKGIKSFIFRLSNGYGYPMDTLIRRWTLVVNDLCRQAVTSGKIVLKSSGKQYRDFISLHDVARAVYYFMESDSINDGLFNLGGECCMAIREIAKLVGSIYEKQYGKKIIEIVWKRDNGEVPQKVNYSIEKIKDTGFSLEGDMVREITKTLFMCESFIK